MERVLTCIVCPKGCEMHITLDDDGKILDITGNTCKRGTVYAEAECTHPVRTVTSTVRAHCGKIVPVKTSSPIPKELIFEAARLINSATVSDTAVIGDVVIANILGTGADIVVTANVEDCE